MKRDFTAARVNERRAADITYVRTAAGWGYAAFVLDGFSRLVVTAPPCAGRASS
jgi:putative transposase